MSKPTSNTEPVKYNFFIVHPAKLFILSAATLAVYLLYWGYKNWNVIKKTDKSAIKPFWRSFFSIFYLYPLLKKMNVANAKLLTALYLLPCFLCLWPTIWWIEILAILPIAFAQKRYNEQSDANVAFTFTPQAIAWAVIGIIFTFGVARSGIMTQPYSFQTSETPAVQVQEQPGDSQQQRQVEDQEKPEDNQEKPAQEDIGGAEPEEVAPKPESTSAAPKVAVAQPTPAPSAPKAATPQPTKKPAYQILYGGSLNTSVSSIHIQRSSGLPKQTFTISSSDGKLISHPQTVGSAMWLASSSSLPDRATSFTFFLQTGGVPSGTYTVNLEALRSTDDATWRYTGSILVHITD